MSSDTPKPNPYQPPPSIDDRLDPTVSTEVTFQLTDRLRRYAEAQYMLHWHPNRLLLSSLAMIIGSLAVLILALAYTFVSFMLVLLFVLLTAAAIYTALVYRTQRIVRLKLEEYGLNGNEMITLHSDIEQLTLVSPRGSFTWPNHQVKIYRTRRGLLICPEPLLFLFVPRESDFQVERYGQFVKIMQLRTSAKTSIFGAAEVNPDREA